MRFIDKRFGYTLEVTNPKLIAMYDKSDLYEKVVEKAVSKADSQPTLKTSKKK